MAAGRLSGEPGFRARLNSSQGEGHGRERSCCDHHPAVRVL